MVKIAEKYADYNGYYEEPLAKQSALWADLYALTMGQSFFTNGKHNLNTTFHAYIRSNPFNGSYLVTGGQNIALEWLIENWKFDDRDIDLLRNKTVPDDDGNPVALFTEDFLEMLKDSKLELTIDAMEEGELAFPDEPIYRVSGPLWQCLMVEAALLNITNSQSLFATLASRLKTVAEGGPVLEFGLRRAQTLGGLEPTRGAYLGGVDATSNMLAEKYYDIPSKGTFAHALVMTYEDELQAFREYAGAMPYNGIFLVDTYDTVEGVKKAVQVCKEQGIKLKGIRLDSGDLTYLSIEARKIMDAAGFPDAKIAASNDLNEKTMAAMKAEGCKIDIWGIGTNLVTSQAQPALGAVYKLAAVYDGTLSQAEIESTKELIKSGRLPRGESFVRDVIKMAEDAVKVTTPGELDVLRSVILDDDGKAVRFNGDIIVRNIEKSPITENANPGFDYPDVLARDIISLQKQDDTLSKLFSAASSVYRPIKPAICKGKLVRPIQTVHTARKYAAKQLGLLEASHKRPVKSHVYVAGIEEDLFDQRKHMIRERRRDKTKVPQPT